MALFMIRFVFSAFIFILYLVHIGQDFQLGLLTSDFLQQEYQSHRQNRKLVMSIVLSPMLTFPSCSPIASDIPFDKTVEKSEREKHPCLFPMVLNHSPAL